ncbi:MULTISPECIES: hypothetical protein [Pseudomonas]|uniref:hypothetical protein n=1 Tax=Pseudomonas TaxID=286 RepID=UPI000F02836B|nr:MULTISPECIES: hypothetical protein [Pseudomonas]MBD8615185.1 hypothetical protein [Pseudomonas putida]MBD8682161.1 hypothetical protein [Pseudomonas sp. CFBP 13719]
MNLTSEVSELFVKALSSGQKELAAALAPFTSLTEMIFKLRDKEGFDWIANAGLLSRSSYTRDETDKLASKSLLISEDYRKALSGAIAKCDDKKSLEHLFEYLMRSGFHDLALEIVEKVPDRVDMSIKLGSEFDFWRKSQGGQSCLYAVGSGSSIKSTTLKIMDMLGVSLPSYLATSEYSQSTYYNDTWEFERFAVQVDLVASTMASEGVQIPHLAFKAGHAYLDHSAMAKAFFESRHHAERLGGWHADVFPSLVPVIVNDRDAPAVARMGGFILSPKFECVVTDANGTQSIHPHHGFEDRSGALSADEVMLATSFLSYDAVSNLRSDEFQSGQKIALLRAEMIPALHMDDSTPSKALSFAMRHHRPEPLLLAKQENNYCSDYLNTRLYLKGADPVFITSRGRQASLGITRELTLNSSMAGHFQSKSELQWLSTWIRGNHHPIERYSLLKHDPALTNDQNVDLMLETMNRYHAALGDGVQYRTRAPVEFYEFLEKKKLGLTLPIEFEVLNHKDAEGWNLHARPRLRTSLGYNNAGLMKTIGSKPEDWLNKAVRIKDEAVRQACMGLLDRLPLEEVVKLATTQARAEFLLENFDLAPISEQLPARLRDRVVTKRFAIDLGL